MLLLEESRPRILAKRLLPSNLAKHFPFATLAIIEAPKFQRFQGINTTQ